MKKVLFLSLILSLTLFSLSIAAEQAIQANNTPAAAQASCPPSDCEQACKPSACQEVCLPTSCDQQASLESKTQATTASHQTIAATKTASLTKSQNCQPAECALKLAAQTAKTRSQVAVK